MPFRIIFRCRTACHCTGLPAGMPSHRLSRGHAVAQARPWACHRTGSPASMPSHRLARGHAVAQARPWACRRTGSPVGMPSHRLTCGHAVAQARPRACHSSVNAVLEKLPTTTGHPRYLILETERDGQLNHGFIVRVRRDIQQGLQIGTTGQQSLESVGMRCRR